MAEFDVLIAGAGPAGCATAISLADFAPELRVCLVDASALDAVRVGETVAPPIKPILDHLGLLQSFAADRHCASYRTLSAWDSPHLASNEFLFQTQQVGWRLDRARFDAMMLQAAAARVVRYVRTSVIALSRVDDCWCIPMRDGAIHTARFAVDATGRAAVLGRSQGLRPVNLDKLVGCFVQFEGAADDGEGLMIETFADGWWYTAAIPDGRRVVACMSDAGLVKRLGIGEVDRWMQALKATRHARLTVSGARPVGPPKLRLAGSRYLTGDISIPLICVGDAASCFDPVSGQGIVKALRSGIFASYVTADFLRRTDESGLTRYRSFVQGEFSAYWQTLRDYYALEQRWPDHLFWQRRHHDDASRRDLQSSATPSDVAPTSR